MMKSVLLLLFALNFALANLTDEGQTVYNAGELSGCDSLPRYTKTAANTPKPPRFLSEPAKKDLV